MSFFGISMVVKTSVSPRSLLRPVRAQVSDLDSSMAVFNIETMQECVDKSLLVPRACAGLLAVFGAVGLAVATVGLYGVMSYSVRPRRREIGIRVTLGANPGSMLATRKPQLDTWALANSCGIWPRLDVRCWHETSSRLLGSGTCPCGTCPVLR